MRILIDECAPKKLQSVLMANGYDCTTVQEAGWSGKSNGELFSLADALFDVLITIDQNVRYQQNLTGRQRGLIVVRCRSNRLVDLNLSFPLVLPHSELSNRALWLRWDCHPRQADL